MTRQVHCRHANLSWKTSLFDKCAQRGIQSTVPQATKIRRGTYMILNILKLGHELRDGEKTTKQKYYWKQDDARNLKVIHAHLFFVNMQLFVVTVTRISARFSIVLSLVEWLGLLFIMCFLSGGIFTCSNNKLHNSQQYHSEICCEFFHLFLLQVKIPPENT